MSSLGPGALRVPTPLTSWRSEFRAGVATFLTMAYILVVNPQILAKAGMPVEASLAATAISAAVATATMAAWSNLPIAMAPGMGLNAFFAFTLCGAMGIPWPTALGVVFLSGLINPLLAFSRARDAIVEGIPKDLKLAIAAGIGLFLALLGLEAIGLVVAHPVTLVTRGPLGAPRTLLGLAGLAATGLLVVRRVPGALILGILGTSLVAFALGAAPPPARIFAPPPSPAPLFLGFDLVGACDPRLLGVLFTFVFVDCFDSVGTLLAVARPCGVSATAEDPRMRAALRADAVGTMIGALAGTSSTTSYIESAAGVEEGGRTGRTGFVVAILFLLALVAHPLLTSIPPFATGAALVLVGLAMARDLREIDFATPTIGIPAFLTIVLMPFCFSISTGIGVGLAAHVLLAWGTGRGREVPPILYAILLLFLVSVVAGG